MAENNTPQLKDAVKHQVDNGSGCLHFGVQGIDVRLTDDDLMPFTNGEFDWLKGLIEDV